MRGETSYVAVDGGEVAYQVLGSGPLDLLLAPHVVSNVEARWDDPRHARFLERLAGFARVIVLDARGTGLSGGSAPTAASIVQDWRDDAVAVMDEVGSAQAAVLGSGASTPIALALAADAPERVRALVVVNGSARFTRASDYPIGLSEQTVTGYGDRMAASWGRLALLDELAPSDRGDEELERQHARYQRLAATPAVAGRIIRALAGADARASLRRVSVPTLVVHRRGNRYLSLAHGRYLAEQIPGARFVEIDGDDHLYYAGDMDAVLDEVQDFLVGTRGPVEPDRRVVTVVFTDLVGSTALSARLGEERWRRVNDRHLAAVRREVERFRGRVQQEVGDGTLSVFDSARAAVRAGLAATSAVRALGLEVRVGVHTGEVDVVDAEVHGLALHLAARVQALAQPGEVLVSRTVADVLSGVTVALTPRGVHELRGVPGRWELYAAGS